MRRAAAAVLAVAVLALAGCSQAADEPEEAAASSAARAPETPTPEPSATPAPVEVTPTPEATEPTPEDQMREIIQYGYAYLDVPEDELLAAAYYVCEQLDAGVQTQDIIALQGVTPTQNNSFVNDADLRLCNPR